MLASLYQRATRKWESFCPPCHQKRALLFAEHVAEEVLGEVPIRQYMVTIPKMLRLGFKYDRKLLGELSRCFYDSIKEIFLLAAPQAGTHSAGSPLLPAMISSVQTYGDDLPVSITIFTAWLRMDWFLRNTRFSWFCSTRAS